MSYGRNNTIISQGTVVAKGTGGKAVAFDFGMNLLGDDLERRGSYIYTLKDVKKDVTDPLNPANAIYDDIKELEGPLVSTFELSGSLEGSYASIYIAKNAYVNQINVLKGASIKGDIISEWDPNNEYISNNAPQNLYTDLNFGYGVNVDGTSSDSGDDSFFMTLDGSIAGYKSLNVNHKAGTLNIEGTVSAYNLNNSGYLAIKGTTADKYSAEIQNYFETSGSLETGFYADSTSDKIKTAYASLDGNWILRPNRDFYSNKARISPEFPVVAAGTLTKNFSTANAVGSFSPTLKMRITNNNANSPEIEMYRDSDAYSRYAESSADAEVGSALYGI